MNIKSFFLIGVNWAGNCVRSLKYSIFCLATDRYRDKSAGVNMRKKMAGKAKTKKTKIEKVMHEFKEGTLKSGSKKGPKVKKRSQAVAIALSEARKAGAKIPKKKKK